MTELSFSLIHEIIDSIALRLSARDNDRKTCNYSNELSSHPLNGLGKKKGKGNGSKVRIIENIVQTHDVNGGIETFRQRFVIQFLQIIKL